MELYHYYEKTRPPFLTLTAMPFAQAKETLLSLRTRLPDVDFFLTRRYEMEQRVRDAFAAKGGRPVRRAPVYCTLGENRHMETWFENPGCIKIPISDIDLDTVSFTYGDMFPVFKRELDTGEEYWGQVYRYDEIVALIGKYGYPEDPEYHMRKGVYPKDRPIRDYLKYIEAHIWSDEALKRYADVR